MPFIYPTAVELNELERELMPTKMAGRLGFEIMPTRNVMTGKVRWTQKDNYYGLQQLRGLDGQPSFVSRVGQKTYEYEPGVFGEYIDITETELTNRAASFDISQVNITIDDLVVEADDLLMLRELDRMEASIWTLLTTGTISILLPGSNGQMVGYRDTYAIQTYTAGVAWATVATATPIANFQAVQQLGVGISVNFGSGATAYMNRVTANYLVNNQNNADVNGRRAEFGATINSLDGVNKILLGQDLPQVKVYEGGYIATIGGSFTKFIPNNKVVVVGQRVSGARVGEYLKTRNLNNPGGAPGSYRYVKDYANAKNAEKRTPPTLEIHRGHNGGPTIEYPSAIVLMSV